MAPRRPGMTPSDAFQRQPSADQRAMQLDCLHRIRGATRVVAAAGRKQRADHEAIHAQHADQRPPDHRPRVDVPGSLHNLFQSSSAARRTPANPCRPSPWPETMMTMSQFGNLPRACRNDSRIWRLAPFRSTARRSTLRGATTPSREAHILFAAAMRRNGPLRKRQQGLLKTRSNSALRVSRALGGKRYSP